jgi:undecaprenyl-diphosphatase
MRLPQESSEHNKSNAFAVSDNVSPDVKKARLISIISLLFLAASIAILTLIRHNVEDPAMHFLNLLSRKYSVVDYNFIFLAERASISGIVFLSLIWYLWFCSTEPEYRSRILIGTLGAAFSGILSRGLQVTIPIHLRPLHNPELAFLPPLGVDPNRLNHWNSFPSDHAAVFFSLATVIWFGKPKLGYLAFAWSIIVNASRIYTGYHYPTDVLGGGALGALVVLAASGW